MKKSLAVLLVLIALGASAFAAPKSKVKIALIIESTIDDRLGASP